MFPREFAEWSDFWWEKAGNFSCRRVLLIGDSITRSYRNRVQEYYKPRKIAIDKLCGSRCAGDPILTAELDLATGTLNGYTYDIIHFNNGLHGGCNDTDIPLDIYQQGIRDIIAMLQRNQSQAKIVIATSTYMSPKGDDSFVIDEKLNAFILERNAFLREFAKENGFILNDLYALTAGNPDFRQSDGIHFEADSADKLADHITELIEKLL
ncbi:MAG: hypothetical protein IJ489_04605 [Clostridia bacterium]|nr:hypothetical protein [Clostridia bacterium]